MRVTTDICLMLSAITFLCFVPKRYTSRKVTKNQYRLRYFINRTQKKLCTLCFIDYFLKLSQCSSGWKTWKKPELALSSWKSFSMQKRADCGKPTNVIENSAWFHWGFFIMQTFPSGNLDTLKNFIKKFAKAERSLFRVCFWFTVQLEKFRTYLQ